MKCDKMDSPPPRLLVYNAKFPPSKTRSRWTMDDVRRDWLRLVISRAYAAEITSDRGAGDGVDTVQAIFLAWAYTVNLKAGLCDLPASPGMAWPSR